MSEIQVVDVLGCGFGPANLAIAAAITDNWALGQAKQIQSALFIEKHPEFLWHPGMLIPGARMQISCLKDLVTLRNPSSPLSFLSYLHSQNRLASFINRGLMTPPRREFADYLSWAANEVQRRGIQVAYAEEVIGISKVLVDDDIESKDGDSSEFIEVTSREKNTGKLIMRRTRHLILSPGGSPFFPPVISHLFSLEPQEMIPEDVPTHCLPIIHTASYMNSITSLLSRQLQKHRSLKIAFVGSGQSAAECLIDVYKRLELWPCVEAPHEIHMIIRKGSLKPSDDSPFVNEIFDPDTTDIWYELSSSHSRKSKLQEYSNTNYGVVNPLTLDSLYQIMYDQKLSDSIASRKGREFVSSAPRVTIRTHQDLISAKCSNSMDEDGPSMTSIDLTCQHILTHEVTDVTYDLVICGTGYQRNSWLPLLRSSNLAETYGITAKDTSVKLLPQHHSISRPEAFEHDAMKYGFIEEKDIETGKIYPTDLSESGLHSSSGSSPSTPPSSLELSVEMPLPQTLNSLHISRSYRLLPHSNVKEDQTAGGSRIYLQGCEEVTHGLSDSLLSILGVRAGEVVNDICNVTCSGI